MTKTFRALAFLLQFATLGLALAFVATRLWPERFGSGTAPVASPGAGTPGPSSYSSAIAKAIPAVVNIYTRRLVTEPGRTFGDQFLDGQAGFSPTRQRLERSLGAGVIVRADGYVLTNHHVIMGADDILIGLWDGRLIMAKTVGVDRDTDLAVLKIDAEKLPVLQPDEQRAPTVGDVVLAIGNPFGLGQTATLGIVSAVGRNQQSLSHYEEFIQTDAAINFGSSGGALVDTNGKLVGINTAKIPRELTGQSQGISFAIPAQAAMRVLTEIIAHGFVVRGWMGAEYADNPVPTAGQPRGVMVTRVLIGSPAHLAGLAGGDVLTRFNQSEIENESDLRSREAALPPGTEVEVSGSRGGLPFNLKLKLIQRQLPER